MPRTNETVGAIDVEQVGQRWVGTYRAPDGRVAVVTEEGATPEVALESAAKWVASAARAPVDERTPVAWFASLQYPGRFDVWISTRNGTRSMIPRRRVSA